MASSPQAFFQEPAEPPVHLEGENPRRGACQQFRHRSEPGTDLPHRLLGWGARISTSRCRAPRLTRKFWPHLFFSARPRSLQQGADVRRRIEVHARRPLQRKHRRRKQHGKPGPAASHGDKRKGRKSARGSGQSVAGARSDDLVEHARKPGRTASCSRGQGTSESGSHARPAQRYAGGQRHEDEACHEARRDTTSRTGRSPGGASRPGRRRTSRMRGGGTGGGCDASGRCTRAPMHEDPGRARETRAGRTG